MNRIQWFLDVMLRISDESSPRTPRRGESDSWLEKRNSLHMSHSKKQFQIQPIISIIILAFVVSRESDRTSAQLMDWRTFTMWNKESNDWRDWSFGQHYLEVAKIFIARSRRREDDKETNQCQISTSNFF